jgi:hypothetical protein
MQRVLTGEGSPICHSTGEIVEGAKRIYREDRLCRGARNFALQTFHASGFLEAPTDAAWEKKLAEIEQ